MATELEHTADVGFRVSARTLDKLFEEAGLALMNMLVDTHELIRVDSRKMELVADTREDLMFSWLSELVYLFDAEHLVWSEVVVEITPTDDGSIQLNAFVSGEKIDPERHSIRTYIKAVTLHQLRVEEDADGWLAEVYLDV